MRRMGPRSLKVAVKRPSRGRRVPPLRRVLPAHGVSTPTARLKIAACCQDRSLDRPPARAARTSTEVNARGLLEPARRLFRTLPCGALKNHFRASSEEDPLGTPFRGKPRLEEPRGTRTGCRLLPCALTDPKNGPGGDGVRWRNRPVFALSGLFHPDNALEL